MGDGLFPVVKQPGRVINHPPAYSTWVTERAELYFYFPSFPVWQVIEGNLHSIMHHDLERNINLVIIWFGFVKSICLLKTAVHLISFHRFWFTGSGTCAGVQLFSILRFSFAEKECVLAYLWFVSTDFYLQQAKEHVLVYSWSVCPRCWT